MINFLFEKKVDFNLSKTKKTTSNPHQYFPIQLLFLNQNFMLKLPSYLKTLKDIPSSFQLLILQSFQYIIDLIDYLQSLDEKNFDFNQKNEKGDTPLHIVCQSENFSVETINFLIEKKAEINSKNEENNSPLHIAMNNNNLSYDPINFLLQKKAEINLKNKNGFTPFHSVASRQINLPRFNQEMKTQFINLFLENKGNVNQVDDNGNAPFHYDLNFDQIISLIDHKADLNLQNKSGAIMHFFFQRDCYKREKFPCYPCDIEFDSLQYLVEKNCEINLKNKALGDTPLHIYFGSSKIKNQLCVIQFLIDKKCDINAENVFQETPLHHFSSRYQKNDQIFKYLIDSKCDFNQKDFYKNTPLHYLSQNPLSTHFLELLIQIDSNFDLPNSNNQTPPYIL